MKYSIGRGIKLYRKKNKISQEKLGLVVGVTRSAISNWEIGRRDITLKDAVEIANFFKISLDELVNPKE